jgi:hypothetical protein
MNEQQFYKVVNEKARELRMSPLLLISGIEGLYSFKDVQIDNINYRFLDNLILTILALRIGDSFHTLAEENLRSSSNKLRESAQQELKELTQDEISQSSNMYLQSFANVLSGKSVIRKYHEKALEVAAFEVQKVQSRFQNPSIGAIVLDICHDMKGNEEFSFLFRA